MIQCAVERFIHKSVAIGLGKATIVAVRNHIETFGIGVIPRQRDARAVAQRLLGTAAIILVTVRPYAGIQRRTVLRASGNNVDYTANRIRAVYRRTRSTHIFDTLHQGDRELAEIGRPRDARLVKADAVNENQDVAGVGATDKERRELPHPAILRRVHAGQATHNVQHRG